MGRKLLISFIATICALVVVAHLIGVAGPGFQIDTANATYRFGIANACVFACRTPTEIDPLFEAEVWAPKFFSELTIGMKHDVLGLIRVQGGPDWGFAISTFLLFVIAATALFVIYLYPLWRTVRRCRRGCCPACNYDLRDIPGNCPECNFDRAEFAHWPYAFRPAARDVKTLLSGVAISLVVVLLGIGTTVRASNAWSQHAASEFRVRTFDRTDYEYLTAPRLSGPVIRVGPMRAFKTIDEAREAFVPGCILVLDRGEHNLGRSRQPFLSDMLIVGQGRDETVFRTESLASAQRVRIQGMTIDCNDDPLTDFRRGGFIQLTDCKVKSYNSGAGGSNAFCGSNSAFLISDCAFDGLTGRQQESRGRFGRAFDLRGDNRLYLERSELIDNGHSIVSAYAVLDRCTTLFQGKKQHWANATEWPAIELRWHEPFTRSNDKFVLYERSSEAFQHATHERPFIDAVLNGTTATGWMKAALDARDWKNDLRYWIVLLRHTDEAIRKIAATQIERLSDQSVMLEPPKSPAGTRPWWEEEVGVNPSLHIEKEYARLIDWYDANK